MDQHYKDGLQIRKQVMGDAFIEKAFASADDCTQVLRHATVHYSFPSAIDAFRVAQKVPKDIEESRQTNLRRASLAQRNAPHASTQHTCG